ncbi:hypothetical protein HN873_012991 [Arachis hypogaea]
MNSSINDEEYSEHINTSHTLRKHIFLTCISFPSLISYFCNPRILDTMSDVPPISIPLPELPDELMLDIFHRADASTILNARSTCRSWRVKLSSYDFQTTLAQRWKHHGCSLLMHFCYPSSLMNSVDWVMRMDASSGYTMPFHFPFLLTYEGWFHIIGVENGILCIRYSSMGKKSYLLSWNPVSRKSKIIQDPVYIFQPDLVYLYALVYFPSTLDYAILYIFKQTSESPSSSLSIYTSFRRNWNVIITCPPYVVTLDATYVTLGGSIYWLTCSVDDDERRSPYIVCFSLLSNTFQQIFIPRQALAHCYMLMLLNQKVCLASSTHDEEVFSTSIWHVAVTEEEPAWTRLFMYNGVAPLFTPAIFLDEDIIEIKERHFEEDGVDDSHVSHFHICRYTPMEKTRRTLHWVEYEDNVRIRSLHVYYETLYPV